GEHLDQTLERAGVERAVALAPAQNAAAELDDTQPRSHPAHGRPPEAWSQASAESTSMRSPSASQKGSARFPRLHRRTLKPASTASRYRASAMYQAQSRIGVP